VQFAHGVITQRSRIIGAPRPFAGRPAMARRNILTTLKKEHEDVRSLFEELKGTTDRAIKGRAELLAEIESKLMPHAKWEEQVLYPAFRERADREGLQTVAEAYLEHGAVEKQVIPEVKAADVGTPEFAGRAKVFAEFVDHHAKEEEKTMFRMAREMFSAEELEALDEAYAEWKASPAGMTAVAAAEAKSSLKSAAKKVLG
jgi:hemerythrin-like domain-containing protein